MLTDKFPDLMITFEALIWGPGGRVGLLVSRSI